MKNYFIGALILISLALTTSCKKTDGEKAEVSEAAAVAEATGTDLTVDTHSSVINWEGVKPTGTHMGTISLSDGIVTIQNKTITGGEFTLDMNSINVMDLEGDSKANLEAHLKGTAREKKDDFFNVVDYPTGKFVITKVTKVNGDDNATHLIYGNLTLKGETKEVGFKALVGMGDNAIKVTTPKFTIDRTQWGINYGSKSVFDNLGDKFVNDEIALSITLNASKAMM